jgi:redox-sensitive bicupin YhaK (pirin superfamily)
MVGASFGRLPRGATVMIIESRLRDVGGIAVRRLLPTARLRHVGPFVFFDHMGPIDLAPGQGLDVPPHPHIGLATVTYLFEGEILHRDSLGTAQMIRAGDVNWMVAGRGIVHSERTPEGARALGGTMHGLQTWVALPVADEEMAPLFEHHPMAALPLIRLAGAELRIVAGTAYGERAPTRVLSPTLYVHARLAANAVLEVTEEHEERAVYVAAGAAELDGQALSAGTMAVLEPGARSHLRATRATEAFLVGGAPLDTPRYIEWNFVSSSRERIERAKGDWKGGRFPKVPGDEIEFVPLPG